MTVRSDHDGTIVLDGICAVEDAEALLQMLQSSPEAGIDWTLCRQLHTAVFQIIVASGRVPRGPCGDQWTERWLAPHLSRNGAVVGRSVSP